MSAQIQFSTKETKQPKLPAQFCVLSSTTGTAAEARFQAWLREGRGEVWEGEGAKLVDVYFTTWRAL